MKNFNFNDNRKLVYSSCLMLALASLTSFNPFSQKSHIAQLDETENSIEFASLNVVAQTMNQINATSYVSRPFENQRSNPQQGQVAQNNSMGQPMRGQRLDRSAETAARFRPGNSGTAPSNNGQNVTATTSVSAALNDVRSNSRYESENGSSTSWVLKEDTPVSDAISAISKDGTIIYVSKIQQFGSTFRVHFKIDATDAGVCTDTELCERKNQLKDKEHFIDVNANSATANTFATAAVRKYEQLLYPNRSSRSGTEVADNSSESFTDDCTDGSYAERNSCLNQLKKQICKRRQTDNCIDKESYLAALETFIQDLTLDPDVSNREFNRYARLAAKDRDASKLIRIAGQYRNFRSSNDLFMKNIDKTLDNMNSIDNQIAYLQQNPYANYWALQMLSNQKQVLALQVENNVQAFKNQYLNSALANTSVNGNGEYSGFAQALRSDLELSYSETVSPISSMFFDQSLATLDRRIYNSTNPNSTNFVNQPFNGQSGQFASNNFHSGFNSSFNAGINTMGCVNSMDPRCSNGYNQFTSMNNQFMTSPFNQNNYNPFDPTGINRRYVNPPFTQGGVQFSGQFSNQFQNPPRI